MDIGHAILKGVIQGLTEFLPVSSTAHLIFTDALAKLFGWQTHTPLPGEEEFFDILLHLGTLVAVVVYFRKDLIHIVATFFGRSTPGESPDLGSLDVKQLPWQMAASISITVFFIIGTLKASEIVMTQMGWASPHVTDISEFYLTHPQFVAIHLLITGGLLFFTETISQKQKEASSVFTYKNAMIIGLFQGFAAIFHGVSRSGSTISAGLASGVDRLTATRYSFLMSVPIFCMAMVYEVLKMSQGNVMSQLNWPAMLIGTVASAVVGYFCVKYFIQFVARHSLKGFAYYCWTVGVCMLVLFFIS